MTRKRYTEEQIISILKEHEAGGKNINYFREYRNGLPEFRHQMGTWRELTV